MKNDETKLKENEIIIDGQPLTVQHIVEVSSSGFAWGGFWIGLGIYMAASLFNK